MYFTACLQKRLTQLTICRFAATKLQFTVTKLIGQMSSFSVFAAGRRASRAPSAVGLRIGATPRGLDVASVHAHPPRVSTHYTSSSIALPEDVGVLDRVARRRRLNRAASATPSTPSGAHLTRGPPTPFLCMLRGAAAAACTTAA